MGTDMKRIFEVSASDCAFEAPDAWCGDPRVYDEHQRQASEVFARYPGVSQLHFDVASDAGTLLTRVSQHDLDTRPAVGAFHGKDYYAYRGGEQVMWQFVGVFVMRNYCWLKWRLNITFGLSKGELVCFLPRSTAKTVLPSPQSDEQSTG
jgi:hypothetical protein